MRLVPRFSLRFVWIALTIFLIMFGVGVKYWRAYQEHERVASKLEALGFTVEEEYDTLAGYVIAKRIIGLQGQFHEATESVTAGLQEIPEKHALKRMSCEISYGSPFDTEHEVFHLDPKSLPKTARCCGRSQRSPRSKCSILKCPIFLAVSCKDLQR